MRTSLSSTENYSDAGEPRPGELLRNSLLLVTLTTLGWYDGSPGSFAKTDVPYRNTLTVIFSPSSFPPYVLAVSWFEVLAARHSRRTHWSRVGEVTGVTVT
jgi:hypothetical protein